MMGLYQRLLGRCGVIEFVGEYDYALHHFGIYASPIELSYNRCFFPTRRVRQGDPLSLYLSVLGMERLRHFIEFVVENKD